MEMSTRSKDNGSTEQTAHKRKSSSPSHSSDDPSSSETSHPPVKKKKKPGAMSSTKDQCALRHGPFYYVKQPALTTDPVDVVPQDGRNDFYCWLCHREGQVLCCELCPRVYHAKCLKLPAEPEGDWFCPECEKITVAECIETQSKAMMMLTIEQLSYLLKFALQKMKQPGDHPRLSSRSPHAASTQRKTFNWTEPFQKPVSLDQHPDYSEYIFHPMDLCSLEKNIKKKTYGCTEAFLADVKWILHNCIIYNGGNHKLTTTAKVIVKICEHEMNEIEVCPECYLSACQKRDNWFCEPCSNPHPLVWAKLKGFPFWPAKALRDKDGQVDARFFGQHDRAWVPLNNCYLMSNDVPFSVKKTKSIFNSAMQEMDVYVENMRKKFGVFNYASFRTPYTPDNNYQMLPDPSDPSSLPPTPEKKEKIKLAFDMTTLPRIPLTRAVCSGVVACQRLLLSDMAPSPQSSPSSDQSPSLSDGEQEAPEKPLVKSGANQSSGSDDSMEYNTGSPALCGRGPTGSSVDGPKPRPSHGPAHQEKTPPTGSILNLNLDRSKAEMDLKELSESVQLKQEVVRVVRSPKRRVKSRFQLNLDKTIESCKAQLGIDELSVDVYKGRSDSEDSEKSESTDSDDASDEEQSTTDTGPRKDPHNLLTKEKGPEEEDGLKEGVVSGDSGAATVAVTKEKLSGESETTRATPGSPTSGEGPQRNLDKPPVDDSDSERELVIDLGEEKTGKDRRRNKKDMKESTAAKTEGKPLNPPTLSSQSSPVPSTPTPGPAHSSMPLPVTMVSFNTHSPATINLTSLPNASATAPTASSTSASSTPALKKQRPLLPRESVAVVQKAVVWNPTSKTTTSSQKWHMQKVQRQQQHVEANGSSSQSARYQTRQAAKAVQQKDVPVTSVALASLATLAAPAVVPAEDIPTASSEVAADIAKYTNKIMDAIKGTMSEIYNDLSKSSSGNTIAEIRRLRIEIEKLQWLHQQELSEMKHNLELTMAEMRQSLEQEKERLVAEVKKQAEQEKQQAVEETKKKQWCANCRKEAIFYCCWNTSYCDYPCQQAHWPEHMKSCTQSAAAPQQEPEPITELRNNGSAPTNADSAPLKDPSDSAPSDKNCETEKKSNANVAVTLSSPTLQG